MKKSQKRLENIMSYRLIFLVLLLIAGVVLAGNILKRKKTEQLIAQSTEIALVDSTPNFNNLSLNDLPHFTDIRTVFMFNGHLFVTGYKMIVEYDLEQKKYVRMNDPHVLPCGNDFAHIDDYLYVVCYESSYGADPVEKNLIYTIHIPTGKVINRLHIGENPLLTSLTNAYFAVHEKDLWIGLERGVVKMDTISGKMQLFSKLDLGMPETCSYFHVHANNQYIWALPQGAVDCPPGQVSVFDISHKSWKYFGPAEFPRRTNEFNYLWTPVSDPNKLILSYVDQVIPIYEGKNRVDDTFVVKAVSYTGYVWQKIGNFQGFEGHINVKDTLFADATNFYELSGLTQLFRYPNSEGKVSEVEPASLFPRFYVISPKINDAYYLFANDGVYTQATNGLPQKNIAGKLSGTHLLNSIYVTSDQSQAIFMSIGDVCGEGSFSSTITSDYLNLYLIDLRYLSISDLSENNPMFKSIIPKDFNIGCDSSQEAVSYIEDSGSVRIFETITKKKNTLMTINLLKKTVRLFN